MTSSLAGSLLLHRKYETMDGSRRNEKMYDVVIIGAGVSGSAAARELARYRLKICVVEKRRGCVLRNFKGKQRYCTCGV